MNDHNFQGANGGMVINNEIEGDLSEEHVQTGLAANNGYVSR